MESVGITPYTDRKSGIVRAFQPSLGDLQYFPYCILWQMIIAQTQSCCFWGSLST